MELHTQHKDYPISELCRLGHVTRAAYYRWVKHINTPNDELNERLAELVKEIHNEHPDAGYRRIRDFLEHDYGIDVNDYYVIIKYVQKLWNKNVHMISSISLERRLINDHQNQYHS